MLVKVKKSNEGPLDQHATDFLIDKLESIDSQVSIITLGPLTNIAQALEKKPTLKTKIEQIDNTIFNILKQLKTQKQNL